ALRGDTTGHDQEFPTFTGAPNICDSSAEFSSVTRVIDFTGGGIKVLCGYDIDGGTGDVNLNGFPHEIADAVVFANYFTQGKSAFTINENAQVFESDVNRDGLFLTLRDYVELLRWITGEACEFSILKPVPGNEIVEVVIRDDTIFFDREAGAALFVFTGEADPKLLATNMTMSVGRREGKTFALVSSFESERIYPGTVVLCHAQLESVELAGYYGEMLLAKLAIAPTTFQLEQNYPNPFNPTTTISYSLPHDAVVTVTVYNTLGETVRLFTEGMKPAGRHSVTWDSKGQRGKHVASGVYFYKVQAGELVSSRKMLLLK
ncbi:MAG: T9SS type A sorting domain-containing protein, partial [candidate division Zixibacteria bacterium]|nr:T9SS type A sorting domain-containing protein [candidate division Zixibacteria bacterium]